MKGKLYVVSGPSGAGKGTVCLELLKRRPDVEFSVSCATRNARPGEIDGVHYYFISESEFLDMRDSDGMLECAQINGGYWYGTPKKAALDKMEMGKSVLLEIENNGAQQVIMRYPETVSVFILPPCRTALIKRLVDRGTEDLPRLTQRIRKVQSELVAARDYSYLILNDTVDEATKRLERVFDETYETTDQAKETLDKLTDEFSDMDDALSELSDYYNKTRI